MENRTQSVIIQSSLNYFYLKYLFIRKIEERKKLLEPQVLRIADDDDLLENDLEVDESDEENIYDKPPNSFPEGWWFY